VVDRCFHQTYWQIL